MQKVLRNNLEYVLCTQGQESVEVFKTQYQLRHLLRRPHANKPSVSQGLQSFQFSLGLPAHLFMALGGPKLKLFPRRQDSRGIKVAHIQPSTFSTLLTHSKFLLSDSLFCAVIVLEGGQGLGRDDLGKIIPNSSSSSYSCSLPRHLSLFIAPADHCTTHSNGLQNRWSSNPCQDVSVL